MDILLQRRDELLQELFEIQQALEVLGVDLIDPEDAIPPPEESLALPYIAAPDFLLTLRQELFDKGYERYVDFVPKGIIARGLVPELTPENQFEVDWQVGNASFAQGFGIGLSDSPIAPMVAWRMKRKGRAGVQRRWGDPEDGQSGQASIPGVYVYSQPNFKLSGDDAPTLQEIAYEVKEMVRKKINKAEKGDIGVDFSPSRPA